MTCFSLPTFYFIVNLVYDLILIQDRHQDQACAPRLAIISHQNSLSITVIKNKTQTKAILFHCSLVTKWPFLRLPVVRFCLPLRLKNHHQNALKSRSRLGLRQELKDFNKKTFIRIIIYIFPMVAIKFLFYTSIFQINSIPQLKHLLDAQLAQQILAKEKK